MKYFWLILLLLAPSCTLAQTVSLGNGKMEFTPPAKPWEFIALADHGTAAQYGLAGGKGGMLVAYVANKGKTAGMEQAVQDDIHKQLVVRFRQTRTEPITEPRIDHDDRFQLVIFEQWRKEGKVASQWHIYRNVPPHQVVITMMFIGDDEKEQAAAKKAAEDVAMSVQLIAPGQKNASPSPPSRAKAAGVSDEVKQAQAQLDAATTACLAKLANDPKFAAAQKDADAAKAKLDQLRASPDADRDQIAQASQTWIEKKGAAESLKKAALDNDADVTAARKKLADAKEAR